MTKVVASLKIDFKFDEQGILRIVDIGDGLGADMNGFQDTPLEAKILRDMHEATGAMVATVFGELPFDAMVPESIHVPLVLRNSSSQTHSSLRTEDFPSNSERILPCSDFGRITSYVSSAWGMQKDTVLVTPVALMALEMHKILWYYLMEKHMPSTEQKSVIYWSNDTNPSEIDLNKIDFKNGIFIKIADRSIGGGNDVYYAKDKNELLNITNKLHNAQNISTDHYKKHIYVLEPAYSTLKKHDERDYNVTGRAFITLIYDKSTKILDVKVSGAKWMFPLEALKSIKTQDQMLSNIKHSIKMLPLSTDELEKLSSSLLDSYGEVFKVGFEHDDLMTYSADHPNMEQFKSCLRPNSSYVQCLKEFYSSEQSFNGKKENFLNALINGFVDTHIVKNFSLKLDQYSLSRNTFFSPTTTSSHNDLMKRICLFSFMECYVAHVKTMDNNLYNWFPFLPPLIEKEFKIKSTLDQLISDYLTLKNKYDIKDKNKALRQAASIGDITVLKLLIYTHRADVNAASPTYKTAMDYALLCKDQKLKEQCVNLLIQTGGKVGVQPIIEESTSAMLTTT